MTHPFQERPCQAQLSLLRDCVPFSQCHPSPRSCRNLTGSPWLCPLWHCDFLLERCYPSDCPGILPVGCSSVPPSTRFASWLCSVTHAGDRTLPILTSAVPRTCCSNEDSRSSAPGTLGGLELGQLPLVIWRSSVTPPRPPPWETIRACSPRDSRTAGRTQPPGRSLQLPRASLAGTVLQVGTGVAR